MFLLLGIVGVFLLFLIAFLSVAFTLINTVRPARRPGTPEPEDTSPPPND